MSEELAKALLRAETHLDECDLERSGLIAELDRREAETALLQGRIVTLERGIELAKRYVTDTGLREDLDAWGRWLAEYESTRPTPPSDGPDEAVHIPLVEPKRD